MSRQMFDVTMYSRVIVDDGDPYETDLASVIDGNDWSEEEISEIIEALEQTGNFVSEDATHGVRFTIKVKP